MIFWLGVIVVSPLWGSISTQLFLQGWLSFAGLVISVIGFIRGRVPRLEVLQGLGVNLFSVVLWFGLLRLGSWLLMDVLSFGASTAENVVYWIFAAFSALWMLPQMPRKILNSWHFVMTPGFLEQKSFERGAAS